MVALFVGDEAALSPKKSADAQRETKEAARGRRASTMRPKEARAGKKKPRAQMDLPPMIRNAELQRRQVRMPEALREIGVDERALAETIRELLLTRRAVQSEGMEGMANGKFVMELVKECVRILEGPKNAASEDASDAPTIIRLTHNIPRPDRGSGTEG